MMMLVDERDVTGAARVGIVRINSWVPHEPMGQLAVYHRST
jgi:hypothetical protein